MNIYVFMGTHLGEIRHCAGHLAELVQDQGPVELHLPEDLKGPEGGCDVHSYRPDDVLWVFDPDQEGTAFIVLDPRQELIGQLEQLADNLKKCLLEPLKVVTFVDCQRAETEGRLQKWLDAAIYYSDLVLLGNRLQASKAFVRDFQKDYQRRCYPCLFLLLKGEGIPSDAREILTPGARRITQLFDLPGEIPAEALPGVVIEASCDLDLEETEFDPYRMPEGDNPPVPVPVPAEYVQI